MTIKESPLRKKNRMDFPRIEPQYTSIPPWEDLDIAIVGEAPGKDEISEGIPFVGRAGKLLDEMLIAADIDRLTCYITNVFLVRPPDNKITHFFKGPKLAEEFDIPICSDIASFNGLYLREEYLPELERLANELSDMKPKVIIALGSIAMWALIGLDKGITKERGKVYSSELLPDTSVLVTLHTSYILRNRNEKDTVIKDLIKAKQLCV